MQLDEFLTATATRVPAAGEMIELCDTLGITFGVEDGKPFMKPNGSKREAELLAKLFRREPFRSTVISAKMLESEKPAAAPEAEPKAEEPVLEKVDVPPGATIVIADARGHSGVMRKGEPYMWTWIGADRWYYVSKHQMPEQESCVNQQPTTCSASSATPATGSSPTLW